MEKPLVSIITPSYNQKKFVRQTIESVLSQDYERIEYIVVDGESTDGSLDIIREYEDRLTYVSEKDNGQSDAINKGFKMAHGEIVAWLNSDDIYEPGCISRAVEEFLKNEKVGLVYGDGYIIDENSVKLKVFEHTQEFDLWKLTNFWDYIMQPATFFRASCLKEVDYLNVNLHYCMDWDLWIKLANVSEVKYVNECLACSREYAETKTSTGGEVRLKEITELLQRYSGKEKPLGVYSYGASTRYTKYAKGALSSKIMARYLAKTHERLNKLMPVRYTDNWIGKEFVLIAPAYAEKIRITYENVFEKLLPLKMFIYIDERGKEENIDTLGKNTIELSLTKDGKMKEIRIEIDKSARVDGDNRELSIKILQIEFI